MSSDKPAFSDRTPVSASRNLTERVKGRVTEARLALDRPSPGLGSKPQQLRRTHAKKPATGPLASADAEREAQSLRHVYQELKATYRRYRRETGRPPQVPALREAVHAFRRGPSLTSLVGVAAFLDDRGLLAW